MKYSKEAVYTYVHDAIREHYPNSYITGRRVAKPAQFPACLITEIDRNRPQQNIQLDFQDEQWESVFEIQVVSVKPKAASVEASDIMDIARKAFNDLYYWEFTETNVDNGVTYTLIGRFRRVIGGGDSMPTISA